MLRRPTPLIANDNLGVLRRRLGTGDIAFATRARDRGPVARAGGPRAHPRDGGHPGIHGGHFARLERTIWIIGTRLVAAKGAATLGLAKTLWRVHAYGLRALHDDVDGALLPPRVYEDSAAVDPPEGEVHDGRRLSV